MVAICRLRVDTSALCAFLSRSAESTTLAWACFQTDNSKSSSATRFSSSEFRLTVALDKSGTSRVSTDRLRGGGGGLPNNLLRASSLHGEDASDCSCGSALGP